MADKAQDSPSPTHTPPKKGSFSRSSLPYLIAAMMASAAMAWYFFVFVPAKMDYFVGLKFRTLAVASAHVEGKVENLERALRSVPVSQQSPKPANGKESSAACRRPLADTDPRKKYLELVLPEFVVDKPGGPPVAGSHLSVCGISGTVAWPDVLAQAAAASRRDFDDLILADSTGAVVWQRETSTPRIGNLSELLGAADDPGAWSSFSWRARATTPVEKSIKHLRSTAVLKAVNLGGSSSLLLVQAVTLAVNGTAVKTESPPHHYVAGLVSRAGLQRQARRIPAAWLVLFALPVILLFLALPFVKLATLMPKERFRFADVLAMVIATVIAAGLGSIVPFVSTATREADKTLDKFAEIIETGLRDETSDVLRLAKQIVEQQERIASSNPPALQQCAALGSGLPNAPVERRECGLWEALNEKASLELDVVIWFDGQGKQIRKWTTKAQVTGPASHHHFDHFRAVKSGNLWTLRGSTPSSRFTIEPLRAPTTSELGVVFATPVETQPNTFLALNVRPQSLVDTVVPPGYGFAIVAPNGKVLFHSEEGLSLEENFFEEVGDPKGVREKARSERLARWTGDYHGRPHRFRMQPVSALIGSRWQIVTFQELEPVLAAEVQQQSGAFRLGTLNLLLLAMLALGFASYSRMKHQRVRDLVQSVLAEASADPRWILMLVALALVGGTALLLTYVRSMHHRLDWLYGVFVLVPILTLLVTLLGRSWQKADVSPTESTRPTSYRWLLAAELGLLVLLLGALPAVGFARIVHIVRDGQGAERWFEAVQQQWETRQARMRERVNGPNYTARTRELLRDGFAQETGGLDIEARHAYLKILDRVHGPGAATDDPPLLMPSQSLPSAKVPPRVVTSRVSTTLVEPPSDTDSSEVTPSTGQGLVRSLLDWNLFSSKDEPVQSLVYRMNSSRELSVSAVDGRRTLATVAVGGVSSDVSWISLILGLFIVTTSIVAVYWARGRLLPPAIATTPDLEAALRGVPKIGNKVVLLIGPPRTKKDQAVEKAVFDMTGERPIQRIRLLDADIDDQFIEENLEKVNREIKGRSPRPAGNGPVWIHLSNLEAQLVDETARKQVLRLLERLLEGPYDQHRALVVTTSVDPIAHFKELFSQERQGIYDDVVPEVALSRSALLLSRFHRCYLPIGERRETCSGESWNQWWHYDPTKWKETLKSELECFRPLVQVREDLVATWHERAEVPFDELVRAVRARAAAAYELLWTNCTRSEKIVLIQLAQEGFVTAQCWNALAPLIAKGIIVERPVLSIFNHTFRDFLRGIERDVVIQEWERMEGHGLWLVAGRLIGSSAVAGLLFYLLTQDFSVQSLLPIVSGTGVFGAPLIRTLIARVAGKASGVTA